MKQVTREEWNKELAKANKILEEAKELQKNLDVDGAKRKLKKAERFLEYLKAKYIPEKVTFT